MSLTTHPLLRATKKHRHSGRNGRNPDDKDVTLNVIPNVSAFSTGTARMQRISSPRRIGREQRYPILGYGYRNQNLWHLGEPGLSKMTIEGIRRAYPKPLHYHERDAISERIVFVLMPNNIEPSIVKQAFIHMNHLNGRAAQKGVPNLDGFCMGTAAVKERDDLIEHVGCRYQARQGLVNLVPVSHSGWMVLIISKLQCEQVTGVNKNRGHGWVR